ncbi:MAG: helix-turn-helix domain-containing protein [Planctomycetota bacterium]
MIREALRRSRGSINEATELLGISRATMYRKLESYQINRDEYQ